MARHGPTRARAAAGLALTVVLASCRAPAPDRPAPAARPSRVHVTPATFAARARTAGRALLLGTHGTHQATLLPLAPAPSAVLVDVSAARPARPARSNARPLLVAAWLVPSEAPPAAPAPQPAPSVAAGTPALPLPDPPEPDISQAPVAWLALRAAAHALGQDLTELRLAAVAGTGTDATLHDPLAAPALAAGLMASLTGAPALPRAAVPPALLLPDHTVLVLSAAPPRKPRRKPRSGAQAQPDAQRHDRAANTERADAARPWDVRAAFALRTGTRLRGPWPVRADAMALSPALVEHLAARFLEHRGLLLPHWTVLLRLSPGERAPASLRTLVDSAQVQMAAAERARARGETFTAYEHLALAGPATTAAGVLWHVLAHLRAAEPAAAQALVEALAAEADAALATARALIQDIRPATLAGHLDLAGAVQEWLVATSMRSVAGALLAEHALWAGPAPAAAPDVAPESERRQLERAERLTEALAPAVLALAQARAHATRATDALLVPAPASAVPYQCAPAALAALAALDLAVSRSSPEPGAPDPAEPLQHARLHAALDHGQRWARGDVAPATVTAPAAPGAPSVPGAAAGLGLVFATPCARVVAALSAAQLARIERGRALLSRYATDKRLAALIPHADRAAREHARAALAATGAIPATSRLAFHSAHEHVRMDDPAGALTRFWAASLHAELAVTLARHPR
jgi:hypothetical protein